MFGKPNLWHFLVGVTSFISLLLLCAGGKLKSGYDLDKRVRNMMLLKSESPLISMDNERFQAYVKAKPRNYSMVLLLTALAPHRECTMCLEVKNNFELVAKSHFIQDSLNKQLFFAVVDFDDGGASIFEELKLETVPVVMHYPPFGKPKPSNRLDPQIYGFEAENIAKWLRQQVHIQIHVIKPTAYNKLLLATLIAALITLLFYSVKDCAGGLLVNKNAWATLILVYTFIMVSGYTWVNIRGSPFSHEGRNGPVYIVNTSSYQLGAECYIIGAIYALTTLGLILISLAVTLKMNAKIKKGMAVSGICLSVCFFSAMLSVFRQKMDGGYPYRLLFA